MLNSRQRSHLKRLANDIKPIFQIGKGGIGDNAAISISEALEARELVKISVLQNSEVATKEAARELAFQTGAEVVAVIGRKIILYKESKDKKRIVI